MGLLKKVIIGAALFGAYKYVTNKDKLTGRSVLDDIKDNAPKWVEKVKNLKTY
ncbi:YtxH domain-containing protein [Pedobacter flavus]|uniref:YtxH domain-containing protein n=1 Tax=Pedobacter flavus TaxID=3113906 RepID=A0ABU7H321_9SPHI|nr:YtxH domain-containing protein [Pedobacter sp. VNH31]MEE1885636.1 YtxH domain-containing protein [Pedobacter sp. VNH31]